MNRMIKWAGVVLAIIGGGHLTIGLLLSASSFDEWLSFELWGHWWEDTPAANSFWANPAGFGWPLLLVGSLIVWMDRRGIVPPEFLGWAVLGWGVVCAVIVEPTPGPVVVIAAIVLLRGIRVAGAQEGTPVLAS
ncbi:hypothetical protein GCM10011610_20810 [Nocardia rhizosphaerihabitans]|uniref:Uncharacterized protein n=2 Tax=Nocardia rhizosphaerihabitans TaxID=1691570 RepID=A0ABQ2K8L7_9NOCA|nr:hypothetical protein GCM10011610_20810 [Nocardia rhizosphaerihabitans]